MSIYLINYRLSKLIFKFQTVRYFSNEIPTGYRPREVEQKHRSEVTNNSVDKSIRSGTFSILFPPPNVTGNLHLGHCLASTVQDVLVRWERCKGQDTIFIPGTDHAGIATQVVLEKTLRKRGVSRTEMGKEQFLSEICRWKDEYQGNIRKDLKRLGNCFDWDREFFTMDPHQSNAVVEAFVRLFNEQLIYRDGALVNWSCSLESTISDVEVETLDIRQPTLISVPGYDYPIKFGEIHDIAYRINELDREIIVSTTRPETMLGDVAVAVHPDDERYRSLRDSFCWHPFREERIPIVFDETVDREFGTGAVKITPAHDRNDFSLAKKFSFGKPIQVFDDRGLILDQFKLFGGEKRFTARNKIIEFLNENGLYRGKRSHSIQLPICSRSRDVIEYMIKPQWFLKCRQMADRAMEAVKSGRLEIHPVHFEREWFRWLTDCHDWCISRQLWWGHRIPAYQCTIEGKSPIWIAGYNSEDAINRAAKQLQSDPSNILTVQDSDVLDTWFSSALLPFSSFGWPNETDDFRKYYPLNVMETGHDILFFWVARMVMLAEQLTGSLPFKRVLLHGIICDANGRKMSKSLGNVVTPNQVIDGQSLDDLHQAVRKSYTDGILTADECEKSIQGQTKLFPNGIPECGIDALRFTLCSHNIKNHFINFDISECHTNKLFFNKIWQATRFTLSAIDKLTDRNFQTKPLHLNGMDRWIIQCLVETIKLTESEMEKYNFHLITAGLKQFFYQHFCDVYLETTKDDILANNELARSHCFVLLTCLREGLKLMEHFTPFLSIELRGYLPVVPEFQSNEWENDQIVDDVKRILDICQSIRTIKSKNSITRKNNPKVYLTPNSPNIRSLLIDYQPAIKSLTQCKSVYIDSNQSNCSIKSTAFDLCSFGIEIDRNDQITGTENNFNVKKLKKLEAELKKWSAIIERDGYKSSASQEIQKKHQEKIIALKTEIRIIRNMNN